MASSAAYKEMSEIDRIKCHLELEERARHDAETAARESMRQLVRKQRELELLRDVAVAAHEAVDTETPIHIALEGICRYTGWPVGHSYILNRKSGELVSSDWVLKDVESFQKLQEIGDRTRSTSGVDLPERVMSCGEPIWIPNLTQDDKFPRAKFVKGTGIRAGFAFPVLVRGETVAVLEFFAREAHEPDYELLAAMSHVGTQLAYAFERIRRKDQVQYNAFHDALTGLPNRALFVDRVGQAFARRRRQRNYVFAVLAIDIDRFGAINESLGPRAGDQVLVEVGLELQRMLRSSDTTARFSAEALGAHSLARLGGDEYGVLLDNLRHAGDEMRVVERIRDSFRHPLVVDGQEIFISVGVGIAVGSAEKDHPEEILREATIALNRAKLQGYGEHQIYCKEMHDRMVKQLAFENDLRRAIDSGELRLHYQPIFSLADNSLTGFEALVRWQHPARGLVPPADFIPIAEKAGLIESINDWVLHEACRQIQVWLDRFPWFLSYNVSINLTASYFMREGLLREIEGLIHNHALKPQVLRFEVTESQLLRDTDTIIDALEQLGNLGIGAYVDDFGTGYSSLCYLASFRVEALKIDRSFISRFCGCERNAAIVRSIITLGHNLGLKVIAEGVETAEQLACLQNLKCDCVQGYYFSRPLDAEAATSMLEGTYEYGLNAKSPNQVGPT